VFKRNTLWRVSTVDGFCASHILQFLSGFASVELGENNVTKQA